MGRPSLFLSAAFVLSAALFTCGIATPARGSSVPGSVNASAFPGTNAGARMQAAINALETTGGTVDSRALTGMQTINSTITVPAKVTLLLGQATFRATVTPVFRLGSGSRLIGEGALAVPTEATLIELADISGRSAVVGSGSGIVIKSIHLKGVSTTDGSIGFDLQGLVNGQIAYNRVENFATAYRVGWPDNPWKCDCYNLFIDNQVIRAATGVDFDKSTYKNTWIGGNVQPFGIGGIGFRILGGANVLFSPDVENFSHGIAVDIFGAGNAVYNLYAEAGDKVIRFEAQTAHNFVWGMNATSVSSLVQYVTTDTISNIVYANDTGPGGKSVWPYSWGARTFYLGQGNDPNYYSVFATQGNANGGVNLKFTPGSQAETVYGLTGYAPLHVGELSAEGDLSFAGMSVSKGIPWPMPKKVINGASFYCPNCDPPANPLGDCTSRGTKTGSWVHGLNNRWICVP